ncbi:MAG TPA: Fe-S-containing hydro-lyase [Dehalococcoidia bacterium]|nr:Fe-S-containing hydro-lyase [Dehalococcoidia bacterium]
MLKRITLPLNDDIIRELRAGDSVLLTGPVYVARDAAHRRMVEAMERGERLPFDISGQTIYYMGPSPAPPGKVIGSAGPTTSGRMDVYTPRLIEKGLKGMIGKGMRSQAVKEAIVEFRAVYFGAVGGAGAVISRSIRNAEVIAYNDLDAEAVRKIEVEDFPVVVVNDIYGADLYDDGKAAYRKAVK